jgi:chromosome partitioning protein
MLNCKQASEVLKISPVRVKQLLKEHSDLGFEKTDVNNGMIRISPNTMSSLLHLRSIKIKHKRVVIKQQKGGVGGTSLSLISSMRLAQKGARVLYIDLDSEANATSFLAKPEFDIATANSFLEIFKNNTPPIECITATRFENIDMIPSKGMLRRVDKLLTEKNPKLLMDKILSQVENKYDLVFLDLPPTYTRLTESAYLSADLVILPYDTSSFSIEGVLLTHEDLQESIKEYEVKRNIEIKVLMNKYSTTTTASKEAFSSMAKIMNDKILPFTIKASSDIVNCINNGKNLFESKANAEVKANIDELCDYIAPMENTTKAMKH